MTIRRALLPSELPDEATTITASDWQIVQVNGETKLRRIRPGVLPALSVGTAALADLAVTGGKLAGTSVTVDKLAADAVETAKIKDKNVTFAKLQDLTQYQVLARPVASTGSPYGYTCGSYAFTFLGAASTASAACASLGAAQLSGATFTGTLQRTNGMYILAPGVTDDPVYAYQGDTNTGICFPAADTLGFTTGGTGRASFGSSGHFNPGANGSYRLGSSTLRWSEVWCTQTSINTSSDGRLKADIETSDLGLEFIQALRPVSYRWIVGDRVSVPPEDPDAPGARHTIVDRPGVRRHYGLIAQELRDALDGKDFAGYCYDSEADEYGIRYGELIAPLIKAVQELAGQVEALAERVAALDKRRRASESSPSPPGRPYTP
jgi:hypothetical protein